MAPSIQLDLRGMKCPAPIVRLNTEARQLAACQDLEAVADDRAFELDVKAWCRRTGHELVRLEVSGETVTATVRRPG